MNVFGFYPCLCLCAFSKTQNLTPELPALTGTTPFYQEQTFLGGEEEDIQREGQNTYKYISCWHKPMHSCLSPVAVRLHVRHQQKRGRFWATADQAQQRQPWVTECDASHLNRHYLFSKIWVQRASCCPELAFFLSECWMVFVWAAFSNANHWYLTAAV